MESQVNWLTLTDLGRRFGLSAVSCGRMLSTAGMRDDDGMPSDVALDGGYAYRRPDQNANRSVLWHEERCTELLQRVFRNHQVAVRSVVEAERHAQCSVVVHEHTVLDHRSVNGASAERVERHFNVVLVTHLLLSLG